MSTEGELPTSLPKSLNTPKALVRVGELVHGFRDGGKLRDGDDGGDDMMPQLLTLLVFTKTLVQGMIETPQACT